MTAGPCAAINLPETNPASLCAMVRAMVPDTNSDKRPPRAANTRRTGQP